MSSEIGRVLAKICASKVKTIVLLHNFLEFLIHQNTQLFKVGVWVTVSQSTFFCWQVPANLCSQQSVVCGLEIAGVEDLIWKWAHFYNWKDFASLLNDLRELANIWNGLWSLIILNNLHISFKLGARPILVYQQNCELKPMNTLRVF